MPTTREIESQYDGRCSICRANIPAGTRVRFTPRDGDRKSYITHLTCARDEGWATVPASVTENQNRLDRIQRAADLEFKEGFGVRARPFGRSAPPPPTVQPEPPRRAPEPTPEPRPDPGFPVRRNPRARHVTETPPVTAPRPKAYEAKPDCIVCQRGGPGPSHNGSTLCRSGSLASGGYRAHCSCDTCY